MLPVRAQLVHTSRLQNVQSGGGGGGGFDPSALQIWIDPANTSQTGLGYPLDPPTEGQVFTTGNFLDNFGASGTITTFGNTNFDWAEFDEDLLGSGVAGLQRAVSDLFFAYPNRVNAAGYDAVGTNKFACGFAWGSNDATSQIMGHPGPNNIFLTLGNDLILRVNDGVNRDDFGLYPGAAPANNVLHTFILWRQVDGGDVTARIDGLDFPTTVDTTWLTATATSDVLAGYCCSTGPNPRYRGQFLLDFGAGLTDPQATALAIETYLASIYGIVLP